MFKYIRCPKCKGTLSQQDYQIHIKYCSINNKQIPIHPQINPKTTQIPSYNQNKVNYPINNNQVNNNIISQQNNSLYMQPIYNNKNNNFIPNKAYPSNINYNRKKSNQTQIKPEINNKNKIKYNIDNNYNYANNIPSEKRSYFKCNICGKVILSTKEKEHLLNHKSEQEKKDLLLAQNLQDEFIFKNIPPNAIKQQKKIEQYIKQKQNRQNEPNNEKNHNIPNSPHRPHFGNIIIRQINVGPPNYDNTPHIRQIIIPMRLLRNSTRNHNININEFIRRILHHSNENPTAQHIINELPQNKIDDIKKLDKDKQNCVICMEDFKNGDVTTNLPCLHMFHSNCIQCWLKTQNTCPICKFKLTQENINRINRSG